MLRHIVMWRLDDAEDAQPMAARGAAIKERLESLPALIPEIKSFEVGLNINPTGRAWDIVLVSTFESREDLSIYSNHPEHQEVVQTIRALGAEAVVVDYLTGNEVI